MEGHVIRSALHNFVARLRNQSGFVSITELVVVAVIAAPLLASIGGFSLLSLRSERDTTARAQTVSVERNVMGRILREVRQAKNAYAFTPASLVLVRRDGSYWYISCTGADTREGHAGEYVCVRGSQGIPGEVVLAQGVQNQDIFTVTGNYVGVKLRIRPREGRQAIEVQDGAVIRNVTT